MPPILFSDHPRKPGSRLDCLSKFSEEWLLQLDKENVKGLSMFLVFQLVQHFRFTWTNAETCAAQAVGKGERSVRRWRSVLIKHRGQFPSSKQGWECSGRTKNSTRKQRPLFGRMQMSKESRTTTVFSKIPPLSLVLN